MVDIDGLYHLPISHSRISPFASLLTRYEAPRCVLLIEEEPCPVDKDVAARIRIAKEAANLLAKAARN